MAEQFLSAIAQEFPEFIEVNSVLRLAALTWPKFGISAADLIELDPWVVEMIRVSLVDGTS